MNPPSEQKYPSEAVVCDWYNEWEDHLAQLQLVGEPEECLEYFIARKACDWQRKQDSLIAANIPAPTSCNAIEAVLWEVCTQTTSHAICHAIREGTSRE